MALLRGMSKAILEQSATDPKALDQEFIDRHTAGFEEYRAACGATPLRTLVFMNRADMRERGIADLGPVDITSTAKDGSLRSLNGYLAIPYDIPRGCAAGYMPEMNVLCALGDYSTQSDQPIMKHVKVTIGPAA